MKAQHGETIEAGATSGRDDWKRLLWLVVESGIDDIVGLNIHEEATRYADDPGDYEYLRAIRSAIDRGHRRNVGRPFP